MKPPPSNAEALRLQQAAPVGATYGLFVAADELGDLEGYQQPIWQALQIG